MRVLLLSKAFVVAAYRTKLRELAAAGVEVVAVVPESWVDSGRRLQLETSHDDSYRLVSTRMRLNGHFHLHYYPDFPRILNIERPDIVHVDEEPYNLATFLAVRSANVEGLPSIFFTWQNLTRSYPPPFSWMEQYVYGSVGAAIAGSAEAGQVLRTKGFKGEIAEIPQFGVDPEAFRPGPPAERPFTVGFPNRLISAKAPLTAVRAFARLGHDARLEIVGDGELREVVLSEVAALGIADRVRVRSRLPSAEMPNFLRSLDAVLLPSVTTPRWKEQFGRVLIESMATGVPVVASRSGEIPNVLGDAGLLVNEGDELAITESLERLRADRNLREQLGHRGRKRVLQRYTQAAVAQETLRVYRQVMGAR